MIVLHIERSYHEVTQLLGRRTEKFALGAHSDARDLIFFKQRGKRIQLFLSASDRKKLGCSENFYGTLREEEGGVLLKGSFRMPTICYGFAFAPEFAVFCLFLFGGMDFKTMVLFLAVCSIWTLFAFALFRGGTEMMELRNRELIHRIETMLKPPELGGKE